MTETIAPVFRIETPPDEPVIVWSRFVRASPSVVFELWTNPAHIKHWWGPKSTRVIVCEVDLRVGGSYQFVCQASDGAQFGVIGEYTEIDAPHRIVSIVRLDGDPDQEVIDTAEFQEVEGGTLVKGTSRHASMAARDAHAASGMDIGWNQSFAKIDGLLSTISADGLGTLARSPISQATESGA